MILENATEPQPLRQRTYWTAVDLLAADLPPLVFAVDGIVPEGAALLVGSPKVGKSWCALGIAHAVASGGRALGTVPVDPGDVLYLALEDGPRRLRDRLRSILGDEPAPDRLAFLTEAPKVNDEGGGLVDLLDRWADDVDTPRLVVVDVLAKVKPPADGRANAYQADYAALEPLQQWATRRRVAVLIVHHTRKQRDDDPLATVSGTHGLAGAADAVLVLTRSRTAADAVLAITGRDLTERELALTFDAELGTWRVQGDAARYATTPERRAVLDLLDQHGSLTPKRLADLTDVNHDNAKQLLRRMAKAGEVDTDGSGTYLPPQCTPVTPVTPVTDDGGQGDTSDRGDRGAGGAA
jgi:hypothetical protein